MEMLVPPCSPRPRSRAGHLCGDCLLSAECSQHFVTYVSEKTVRIPEVRLGYQNYLVGLRMPYNALIHWVIHAIRDFHGHYRNEEGQIVPIPTYASLLKPATEFWCRDQLTNGPWQSIAEVPLLRSEAVGRWRLIGTTINIKETVFPLCENR